MIEIKAKRTARTLTYQNPDGSFTEKAWASDVCYDNWDARGDGEPGWRKCDPSLVETPQGWRVEYMPYVASFPATADGVFTFRDARAVGGERKNISYSVTPVGIQPVLGSMSSAEIVYPNAYGVGADLVYELRASGVAKLVRIQPDSAVAGPFVFHVDLPQNAVIKRRNAAGEYVIETTGKKHTDSDRRTVIDVGGQETYLVPFRWRSGFDGGTLAMDIEYVNGVWEFTKAIPAEWTREDVLTIDLTASGSTVIDGYMAHIGGGGSTFVNSRDSATSTVGAWTDTNNPISGKRHTTNGACYRFAWGVSNTVPANANVSAVDLYVRINAASGGGVYSNWVGWTPSSYVTPANTDYAIDPPNTGLGIVGSVDFGATTVDGTTGSTDRTVALNAAGLAAFTKNGTNGYACRETTNDFGMTAYAGGLVSSTIFYSEYAVNPAYRPAQTITYTLPSGYQNMMMMGVG